MIPNEVLKTEKVNGFLTKFYKKCFKYSLTPMVWQKAVIVPIPILDQSSSSDELLSSMYVSSSSISSSESENDD
jgi:hypothetical protein